jgi:hypothetical protein
MSDTDETALAQPLRLPASHDRSTIWDLFRVSANATGTDASGDGPRHLCHSYAPVRQQPRDQAQHSPRTVLGAPDARLRPHGVMVWNQQGVPFVVVNGPVTQVGKGEAR